MADQHLTNLAGEIAAALGGPWALRPNNEMHWCAFIDHPDGRSILVSEDHRQRLSFSGSYRALQDQASAAGTTLQTHGLPHGSINVATARGPVVAARDIQRRLLPAYDQGFATARERVTDATAAEASRRDALAQLALSLRTEVSSDSIRLPRECKGYGSFRPDYRGEDVDIELRSIPLGQAMLIAELIRDCRA